MLSKHQKVMVHGAEPYEVDKPQLIRQLRQFRLPATPTPISAKTVFPSPWHGASRLLVWGLLILGLGIFSFGLIASMTGSIDIASALTITQ